MKLVSLNDIAEIFNGKTPSKSEQRSNGFPVLKIKDIDEDGQFKGKYDSFVDDRFVSKTDKRITKVRDILILNAAHNSDYVASKNCIVSNEFTGSLATGEWLIIRADETLVLAKYLYFYINSSLGKSSIKNIVKGIHLYPKDIKDLMLPLPSLKDQENVVQRLEKVNSIRRKRKLSLNLLNKYINSVFLEMFGDPIENTKGWDVKKLKDISLKIHSGSTPKGGAQVYIKEGILFLRSQNVLRNKLDIVDVAYISEETHNKMRNSSLEYKDLVMTKTGRLNTENSSLGRAAIYLGENNRANINGHVYLIRLKKEAVHEFVLFILTTNQYREYIRKICVGGIDKRQINKVHLEEFPIISPPIELQNKFSDILYITESLRQKMDNQSQDLELLYATLMQKSFNTT